MKGECIYMRKRERKRESERKRWTGETALGFTESSGAAGGTRAAAGPVAEDTTRGFLPTEVSDKPFLTIFNLKINCNF